MNCGLREMNRIKQQFFTLIALTTCMSLISGCTVLGFSGDLALSTVLEKSSNTLIEQSGKGKSIPLIMTKEGLKLDVKIAKGLIADHKKSNTEAAAITAEYPEEDVFACKQLLDGKQQCYPASYYQDMCSAQVIRTLFLRNFVHTLLVTAHR